MAARARKTARKGRQAEKKPWRFPGWKKLGMRHPQKGNRYPAEILTPDEVRALIKASSGRSPTGARNRALLAVLYRGGLRIGEAIALQPKDIDAEEGTVRVLHGKGNKARTVGLDAGAMALVKLWLERRRKLGLSNGRRRLFCTLKGKPLMPAYIRQVLPRLAERAGIEKRVHPHALRHTHAAELAQERLPVNVIQQQLGHANLAVTSRYLDHIAPHERVEALKRRDWSL